MDVILSTIRWQYALVYLDDVIVYSRSIEAHLDHVYSVLQLLKDAGVTLQLKKCQFFTDNVDYLGHVIRPGKLQVADKTTEAIEGLKPPTTVTGIRSFLGLCNVFRRFVPNFARISSPLNAKLRKGEPSSFGDLDEKETEAFNILRDKLISPPVLALPNATGRYTVDTDACDRQVRCVLMQDQREDKPNSVGYCSRKLTKAERDYDTT